MAAPHQTMSDTTGVTVLCPRVGRRTMCVSLACMIAWPILQAKAPTLSHARDKCGPHLAAKAAHAVQAPSGPNHLPTTIQCSVADSKQAKHSFSVRGGLLSPGRFATMPSAQITSGTPLVAPTQSLHNPPTIPIAAQPGCSAANPDELNHTNHYHANSQVPLDCCNL